MSTTTKIAAAEAEEMYNDYLDGLHGDFAGHPGSVTLKAVDPIAYRVGFSDYQDMLAEDLGIEVEDA